MSLLQTTVKNKLEHNLVWCSMIYDVYRLQSFTNLTFSYYCVPHYQDLMRRTPLYSPPPTPSPCHSDKDHRRSLGTGYHQAGSDRRRDGPVYTIDNLYLFIHYKFELRPKTVIQFSFFIQFPLKFIPGPGLLFSIAAWQDPANSTLAMSIP